MLLPAARPEWKSWLMVRYFYLAVWMASLLLAVPLAADQQFSFNYQRELFGSPGSLTSLDSATGVVVINGADTRRPTVPFTFEWGDGQTSTGFFPQQLPTRSMR